MIGLYSAKLLVVLLCGHQTVCSAFHQLFDLKCFSDFSVQSTVLSFNILCDSHPYRPKIDSTVIVDNQLWFFFDWFVSIVDISAGKERVIEEKNVTQLIDFGQTVFKPRVVAANTGVDPQKRPVLLMRFKDTTDQTRTIAINIESRTFNNEVTIPDRYQYIDIARFNATIDLVIFKMEYGIAITVHNSAQSNPIPPYHLREDDRLRADISSADPNQWKTHLTKLNNSDITSILYIPETMTDSVFGSGRLVLFADRFWASLALTFDKWQPLVVNSLYDTLCQRDESTTLVDVSSTPSSPTPDPNTNPDTASEYRMTIIVSAIAVSVTAILIVILALFVYLYIGGRNKKNTERSESSGKRDKFSEVFGPTIRE